MATKKTTTKAKVPTKSVATAPKAVKKPAVKKTSAVKKTTVTKKAPAKSPAPVQVTPEQRYRMVEQAAYYLAEKSGFQGDPAAIWVQAEKDVAAQIAAGRL